MIFIASDHAGFELKQKLIEFLKPTGVSDLGTDSTESCDYPLFAEKLCLRVLESPENLGILICGSGIGMSIAANKVNGIRAAVVSEAKSAALAREHNKAQILCLGARIIHEAKAKECVQAFLSAKFDTTNPRHQRRIDELADLELRFRA